MQLYTDDAAANDKRFVAEILAALPVGGLLVFDLGFFSVLWFDDFTASDRFFVTRMQEKTAYRTVQEFSSSPHYRDELIQVGQYRSNPCRYPLRMVAVWWQGTWYRYLTNVLDLQVLSARQVCELYRRRWRIDEVFLTIKGKRQYLWRAVDQDDNVLDILVQSRRKKKAAKEFFRKLLKGLRFVPRVVITDQLKSYGAAQREILPGVEHRQHRYLNNRVANSHQPTRQRERRLQGFKSPGHAQRFLAASGPIAQHFRPRRHRWSASAYRQEMRYRFATWQDLTNLPTAA